MNISRKHWLATGAAFATIGLIAVAIALAAVEVADADRQRRQTTEIAQRYSELRLASFDYLRNRNERARVQWHAVSARIDRLIAANHLRDPERAAIVAALQARRVAAAGLFAALAAIRDADFADAAVRRRFEEQMINRLLIDQQDSLADTFRLAELANRRIETAQHRASRITLAGLGLIALLFGGLSWLIRRHLLAPIVRLQQVTSEIAAGNLSPRLEHGGDDEIGALTRNFDAMTQALRESFARVDISRRSLETANKELEAFSYSVSHDLRAPLRRMDAFSLALIEDYGDRLDEEGKDALARIRAASQRMGALIDDLLRLSRVAHTALDLTQVDLSALAGSIAAEIDREASGRVVEWIIEPNLRLDADAALLRVALQNLLQNAWKFTARTARPVIRVGARRGATGTEFFVADNGAGFDMARAGRLFGPFERLHPVEEYPGTGIGLAIVQRIIHRHGGDIRAEARAGEGASFIFSVTESDNGHDRQAA